MPDVIKVERDTSPLVMLAHRIKAITADFGSAHQGSIPCGPIGIIKEVADLIISVKLQQHYNERRTYVHSFDGCSNQYGSASSC